MPITLDSTLLSHVEVGMSWAIRRQWQPGASLELLNAIPGNLVLYWIESGTLEIELQGKSQELVAGDLALLPPLLIRDRISTPQGACWLSVALNPRVYGRIDISSFVETLLWCHPSETLHRRLTVLQECLLEEWEDNVNDPKHPLARTTHARSDSGRLISEGIGKILFAYCWQEMNLEQCSSPSLSAPSWLFETIQRVQEKPYMSVHELGHAAAVSTAYFRRVFQEHLGQTPQHYLTEARLQTACHLLQTTDSTIALIAAQIGFGSLPHFTQLFTKRYQETPARYRRRIRESQL